MTININGHLLDFDKPLVMGIINVTPDSFYAGSRLSVAPAPQSSVPASPAADGVADASASESPSPLLARARRMLEAGATILDIGAVSTRPGAAPVSADEELRRLETPLAALREAFPNVLLSVDTFRACVARRVVSDFGVQIINDVSAGALDPELFTAVVDLRVPYVLTHSGGFADTALEAASPSLSAASSFLPSVARFFADRLQQLYALGVTDVILDPGFGFGKTLEENYALMRGLPDLIRLFPDNPFLVGVSRKSMVYKLLDTSPDEALNGTTALHTLALQAGAHILRVHDVPEAVQVVRIMQALHASNPQP